MRLEVQPRRWRAAEGYINTKALVVLDAAYDAKPRLLPTWSGIGLGLSTGTSACNARNRDLESTVTVAWSNATECDVVRVKK